MTPLINNDTSDACQHNDYKYKEFNVDDIKMKSVDDGVILCIDAPGFEPHQLFIEVKSDSIEITGETNVMHNDISFKTNIINKKINIKNIDEAFATLRNGYLFLHVIQVSPEDKSEFIKIN